MAQSTPVEGGVHHHTEMEGHALHNESDIGPPNAEPHGLWRILRNSLVLAAGIMFIVAVFFV